MRATAADDPHPDVQELLGMMAEFEVLPFHQHGPEGARQVNEELQPDVEGPSVADVTDLAVPGYQDGPDVPVRLYTPAEAGPYPTLVFFHGGGWVIGNVETHDLACRYLTTETGAQVVSVDYRLAPEHPFPAALEDAYAATEWAAGAPDALDRTGALAVIGDSAGGNLAAAVSLMARDLDGPDIDAQVLIYAAVARDEDWPSMREFAEGHLLFAEDMEWFSESYLPNPIHAANPYASPLEAKSLADLPPATILTAGFDPLRDQGLAYAEALEAEGVDVHYENYEEMIHGFFTMLEGLAELDDAHAAVGLVADDLEDAWS